MVIQVTRMGDIDSETQSLVSFQTDQQRSSGSEIPAVTGGLESVTVEALPEQYASVLRQLVCESERLVVSWEEFANKLKELIPTEEVFNL